MFTEFDKKILSVAAEICGLYASEVSNKTCQDWTGESLPFTRDELKSLVFDYQQWNSGGEDYDEDELSESDGMMVASYIERALLLMRDRGFID